MRDRPIFLVLGGDGALVNALCQHLPPTAIIAGRRRPRALSGQRFVALDVGATSPDAACARVGSADVVINAVGHAGSSLAGYAFNVTSAEFAAALSAKLGARLLQISTLKCDRRVFTGSDDAPAFPYSPYGWSKLCAELAAAAAWSQVSVLRLGYLDDRHSGHYYSVSRLTVDRHVKTVTPETVWRHIMEQASRDGLQRVDVYDDVQRLPALAKRLGVFRALVPVPDALLRAFGARVSTKLLDYLPVDALPESARETR